MSDLNTRHTLLEKIKAANNEDCWEEYVKYYKGYIFALLLAMRIKHEECDDLLQQVLIKCWKKLPEFDYQPERGKFRSWLTTITRNTVRDYIKSKANRNRQQEVTIEEEGAFKQLSNEADVDRIAEEEWKIYVADLALQKVKNDFKPELIDMFLRISKGEKSKDVAADLGISSSSISQYKTRIQKALLKEILRLESYLG